MTAHQPLDLVRGSVRHASPAAWVKRGKGCPACPGPKAVVGAVVDGGRKAHPGREAH